MKSKMMRNYKEYRSEVLKSDKVHKIEEGFIEDGRFHYVYRVKDLEDGTYYYGSRTTKEDPAVDFWKYGTSSDKKTLIREHGKSRFRVKILSIFGNKSEKIIYESFLHQYFDVRNNPKFFNRMNQTPFGINFSGLRRSPELNKQRNSRISAALTREIFVDGRITTPAKENGRKVSKKMRETGTYEIIAKKRLETFDKNGFWEENGKRISKSKNEKILKDGEFLTRAQHSGKRGSETKRKNSRFLNIMKNGEVLLENVPLVEVRRMNQALVYATKENPIGQTVQSKLNLNTNRKLHMIGWYVEEYK